MSQKKLREANQNVIHLDIRKNYCIEECRYKRHSRVVKLYRRHNRKLFVYNSIPTYPARVIVKHQMD